MSDDRTLAADYLLGELDEDARAAVEQRLRTDAGFRARVEALRPVVVGLDALPADAWIEPPVRAPRARVTASPPRRWLVAAAAGVTLVLAAGAGGYALRGAPSSSPPSGPQIALRPVGAGASQAHATATMAAHRRMTVELSGLPAARPGSFYELWLIDGRRHSLALASFSVSSVGRAALSIPLPVDPRRFAYLDVSVQSAAAGPRHSGRSVLRARIA